MQSDYYSADSVDYGEQMNQVAMEIGVLYGMVWCGVWCSVV